MARKALIVKAMKPPKYPVRHVNRCKLCGRSRAYMRKFGVCRICFRELAASGKLPGVTKSSW
ncbi:MULTISPECIES: type Z 30S ribosomal protein S14 [Sphaerobacter]|jgi:small subunit ribosomal protein S14|uniref:Small ribosomal subunit protein uS14 n=1 Tax=Sphaerobacter thermophilus (strain ATCC 49802 / DSM 20745 / KCCM 41009 / NCIMB 13125 / S 6022) TaxID=479434 RepID=D1C2L8_SPHTD|nr:MULTISPECIES: type Z 30S ribosomal protein S14 [Sphaerobacter]ACZ38485.1 ribosomal protein S14 [Sphaerobacter thermophilus DSM 20745]MBX5444389.1 type Z 30S ribosomal protein S14 [Sphaerobacter sp.]PZN68011.1 MAG: type Z 30S ribosomal protein S14 [Sphaerobacter thermophilus]